MFIMFWIGSYWREDTAAPAAAAAAGPAAVRPAPLAAATRHAAPMVAAVLLLSALWPAAAFMGERVNHNPAPVRFDNVAVGWPQAAGFTDWKPAYLEPDVRFQRVYQNAGAPVGLTVLYYRNQNRDKALISSVNRLAGYEDAWHETDAAARMETLAGRPLALRESVLRGPGGKILVWSWKWIGGHYTSSDVAGKLWQAAAKARLQGDDGAAVMLSTPLDDNPDAARAALHAFLADNLQAVDQALEAAAQKH
jgi:EpsI family protein